MNYDIQTLLDGIEVLQRQQLDARAELLRTQEKLMADMVNAGKRAALHVEAVLQGELDRLQRGYGSYGKYGVTKSFYTDLGKNNPFEGDAKGALPFSTRDLQQLQRKIDELREPLRSPTHETMRVLLSYALRNGQTEVTTSWLTRSGFHPSMVNVALLAAETDRLERAVSEPVGRTTEEKAAFAREWDARVEQGRSNA